MAALGTKLRTVEGGKLAFWCPGCDQAHTISVGGNRWTWNGDAEKPTFKPSVLVRSGHFVPGYERGGEGCWCTYNAEHPDEPAPFKCQCCHSFVTDGQIQFLGDCSHAMASKTVPLPEFP